MPPIRSWFRALLAVAVLACALHLGEPTHAADDALHGPAEFSVATDFGDDGDEAASQAESAGHHHCPIAAGYTGTASTAAHIEAALRCTRTFVPLGSLTRAPPLEPPAA